MNSQISTSNLQRIIKIQYLIKARPPCCHVERSETSLIIASRGEEIRETLRVAEDDNCGSGAWDLELCCSYFRSSARLKVPSPRTLRFSTTTWLALPSGPTVKVMPLLPTAFSPSVS